MAPEMRVQVPAASRSRRTRCMWVRFFYAIVLKGARVDILFIGDLVSPRAIDCTIEVVRALSRERKIDAVIANAENVHERNGLNRKHYEALVQGGVDIITLGNHAWDQDGIYDFIDDADRLVRPFNYPATTPGEGYRVIEIDHRPLAVIAALGNVFVSQLPSPFLHIMELVEKLHKDGIRHIVVDIHGEATSEKEALAWYLDGKVSAVLGTHTHVPTADERILPKGTAAQSDVGMVGPWPSVIGMHPDDAVRRFLTQRRVPYRQPKDVQEMRFHGSIIHLNDEGKATSIERIERRIGGKSER